MMFRRGSMSCSLIGHIIPVLASMKVQCPFSPLSKLCVCLTVLLVIVLYSLCSSGSVCIFTLLFKRVLLTRCGVSDDCSFSSFAFPVIRLVSCVLCFLNVSRILNLIEVRRNHSLIINYRILLPHLSCLCIRSLSLHAMWQRGEGLFCSLVCFTSQFHQWNSSAQTVTR